MPFDDHSQVGRRTGEPRELCDHQSPRLTRRDSPERIRKPRALRTLALHWLALGHNLYQLEAQPLALALDHLGLLLELHAPGAARPGNSGVADDRNSLARRYRRR